MNRTIKFRAWSTETKKMTDWNFINSVRNLHKLMTLNHVKLMQFTGLLDRKGKEIYEGDILLLPLDFKGVVKYKEGSFIIENTNNKFYYLGELISHLSYEIIGNIHETPDIL